MVCQNNTACAIIAHYVCCNSTPCVLFLSSCAVLAHQCVGLTHKSRLNITYFKCPQNWHTTHPAALLITQLHFHTKMCQNYTYCAKIAHKMCAIFEDTSNNTLSFSVWDKQPKSCSCCAHALIYIPSHYTIDHMIVVVKVSERKAWFKNWLLKVREYTSYCFIALICKFNPRTLAPNN